MAVVVRWWNAGDDAFLGRGFSFACALFVLREDRGDRREIALARRTRLNGIQRISNDLHHISLHVGDGAHQRFVLVRTVRAGSEIGHHLNEPQLHQGRIIFVELLRRWIVRRISRRCSRSVHFLLFFLVVVRLVIFIIIARQTVRFDIVQRWICR